MREGRHHLCMPGAMLYCQPLNRDEFNSHPDGDEFGYNSTPAGKCKNLPENGSNIVEQSCFSHLYN